MGGYTCNTDRLSAQRWADDINMWPNAVGTFNRPLASVLGIQKVSSGLSGLIDNISDIYDDFKTKKTVWSPWFIKNILD